MNLNTNILVDQPEKIYHDIARYIAGFTGYPIAKIGFETRINKDIKIAGDDAAELLEHFAGVYGIDLKGFQFDDYFYPEGVPLFPDFKWLLFWIKGKEVKKDFTVRNLVNAIETKRMM